MFLRTNQWLKRERKGSLNTQQQIGVSKGGQRRTMRWKRGKHKTNARECIRWRFKLNKHLFHWPCLFFALRSETRTMTTSQDEEMWRDNKGKATDRSKVGVKNFLRWEQLWVKKLESIPVRDENGGVKHYCTLISWGNFKKGFYYWCKMHRCLGSMTLARRRRKEEHFLSTDKSFHFVEQCTSSHIAAKYPSHSRQP